MNVDLMLGKRVRLCGGGEGVVHAVKYHVVSGKTVLVRYQKPGVMLEDGWFEEEQFMTLDGTPLDLRKGLIEIEQVFDIARGTSCR